MYRKFIFIGNPKMLRSANPNLDFSYTVYGVCLSVWLSLNSKNNCRSDWTEII